MKKKLTFIMILVVLALTSCSDFLDKYPKYGVDPESEVTNEIAVALTTACYKTLQSSNMYNQRLWTSTSLPATASRCRRRNRRTRNCSGG